MSQFFPIRKVGDACGVAVGCMNFGKRTPEPEARTMIARALERGLTIFDTANAYNDGESERIVGRALKDVRARSASRPRLALAVP